MTISGAALAPDDDATPDTEDADSALEAGTSDETGISLAIAPEVDNFVSLVATPEVVEPDDPPRTRPTAHRSPEDSPLLAVTGLTTTETAPTPRPPLADRVRGALPFTGPGLTGLGGVLLGSLVTGMGAAVDLGLGDGLGTGFTVTFLVGCVLVASTVRTRALTVAMVLPPLLFAVGYALETRAGGRTTGRREMALDVATSLALHAPVLFVGTALAVAVIVVRVLVHLIRR